MNMSEEQNLKTTPLFEEHLALQARIVPFSGYKMPVQYPEGIISEHLWTRQSAGLFDVSHMGQALLVSDNHEKTASFLETLVPADIISLAPGRQRYTQLLNADAGILDDLMVSRPLEPEMNGTLILVVNAGTKEQDFAHIEKHLPSGITLQREDDRALLALQGPKAEEVLNTMGCALASMKFMDMRSFDLAGFPVRISRSGYTGEDGFEISVSSASVRDLWQKLLCDERVHPVGLGARDSLRLEAGLCLYGHDIDTTTSPAEADILWSVQKRRRLEGGFPGYDKLSKQISEGVQRIRITLTPEGRIPAREGTKIFSKEGEEIGIITSGGFGPSVNKPIAMGYIRKGCDQTGNEIILKVRGKDIPALLTAAPFVPHRYKR